MDILILIKDADGSVEAMELSDLPELGEFARLEAQLAQTLAEEDVENLAAAMDPGSVAGVLIYENLWAAPFASACAAPAASSSPTAGSRSRPSSPRSRPTKRPSKKQESDMPLGPGRRGVGVIGAPVAKAAVVTAAVKPGPSPVAKAAVVGAVVTPGRGGPGGPGRRRF